MRRQLLVAVAALGLLVALPVPARASARVGWWTRSPVASAPEGGIAVANAPDGPTSVAALLVELHQGASGASVTLHQSGGTAPGAAHIEACVVAVFTPRAGGSIADAPATQCRGASVPVVAGDNATWTANLAELVSARTGTVGIALVPAPGASLWELQFDRVDVAVSSARPSPTTPAASEPEATVDASVAPAFADFGASPDPASALVAPPATTSGASSITTRDEGGLALAARTSRRASASSADRGSFVSYVLVAAVVGVIAGLVHRARTGRVSAALRALP